jgi:hypothetical protein
LAGVLEDPQDPRVLPMPRNKRRAFPVTIGQFFATREYLVGKMNKGNEMDKFKEVLLPTKSKTTYTKYYADYLAWCLRQEYDHRTEDSASLYLQTESASKKATTLWSYYSGIKSLLLVRDRIDANSWRLPVAFLKRLGVQQTKKKAKVFTRENIRLFLIDPNGSVRDNSDFYWGSLGDFERKSWPR